MRLILMVIVFMCLHVVLPSALHASKRELVLLHTNDMHARLMGVRSDDSMCTKEDRDTPQCFGGYDKIAHQVAIERTQHAHTLLLDAGDQFQGTSFHLMYQGQASAALMSKIGYQAMAVGNHEFDHGPMVLYKFAQSINFPLLSANIDASQHAELNGAIKPYVIVKQGHLRIGILGYTTEDTAYLSSPGQNIRFLPIIESVKKAVAALKREGVDVIVAVSHSGLNQDMEVAKEVPGIAAIVSGHTNSLLSNKSAKADGPSPLVVRSRDNAPVLLVSAYAYGKYLGKLRFSFNEKGQPTTWVGEPILLDSSVKHDAAIRAEIDRLYEPILALKNKPVATSPVDIDGQSCRFRECSFGNLVADSMLDHTRSLGVEIALMNGGGIRASASKGAITYAHLQDVMPFDKTLVLYRLRGSLIKNLLEHGVAYVEDQKNGNTGRFLQVSGIKYSFDPKKPRGQRVRDVLVAKGKHQWQKLDDSRIYGVVTNSYMAAGGDNYTHFSRLKEYWHISIELKDLMVNYLQNAQSQLPKREGRIVNLRG